MSRGVILYGPPAAGKDTITAYLHALDPVYELFPRLKAGAGRTTGYRCTTNEALDQLHQTGAIVWENARYGARYAIDLPELTARLRRQIPVVHLGQARAIPAVTAATPDADWFIVALWCPRDEAVRRVEQRATGDTEARLRAWDETEPLARADLTLDTAATTPDLAARTIRERHGRGRPDTLRIALG
jgi:guanylate kinase